VAAYDGESESKNVGEMENCLIRQLAEGESPKGSPQGFPGNNEEEGSALGAGEIVAIVFGSLAGVYGLLLIRKHAMGPKKPSDQIM